MLISLLSSIFCSSMVRIQFLTDLDHYLALQLEDNTSSETPFFKSATLMTLKHRSNYCGRAALRNLTHDTFEFYFCGYKMCYNETDNALVVCELNDDIPTWELQKVDLGRTFLIRCGDACITLRYGRVIMEECKEGVNLDQIVHVIPSEDQAKFFVSDDLDVNSRQKAFEANLMDNDESYRLESINYGKEFAKLPSQRNQRASLHN